jgi:hypothetical protein
VDENIELRAAHAMIAPERLVTLAHKLPERWLRYFGHGYKWISAGA